jgi:hypothetical protein
LYACESRTNFDTIINRQQVPPTGTDSSVPTNDDNENAAAEGVIPPEAEVDDADPEEVRVLHDP